MVVSKWLSTSSVAARTGQPGSSLDAKHLLYHTGLDVPERYYYSQIFNFYK